MIGIVLDIITSLTSRDKRAQFLGFGLLGWTGLFALTVMTEFGKDYILFPLENTLDMNLEGTNMFFIWFFVMIGFVVLIRLRFMQLKARGIEP